MTTKRDRQADKKRVRHQARQQKARTIRSNTTRRTRMGGTPEKASRWPVGPCYVSTHWHEADAEEIHAIMVRKTDDGVHAAAIFEINKLQGIQSVTCQVGIDANALQREIGKRSEPNGMYIQDAKMIAQIIRDAKEHTLTQGHTLPSKMSTAETLMGDLLLTESEISIDFGSVEAPKKRKRQLGIFTRLLEHLFKRT